MGCLVTMSAVRKRASQRGNGLEVSAHDDVLAVGDAAFEATGAIAAAREPFARRVIANLIHHFGTIGSGRRDARANFTPLTA